VEDGPDRGGPTCRWQREREEGGGLARGKGRGAAPEEEEGGPDRWAPPVSGVREGGEEGGR
jgi:hypothetical protein